LFDVRSIDSVAAAWAHHASWGAACMSAPSACSVSRAVRACPLPARTPLKAR